MMYSSRAGAKLEFALSQFNLDVSGLTCADLGCSTGGFTSCLLAKGAAKVYAVDTGYGVLDWKLRNDPRVVVMERTNALHVTFPQLLDFVTIDVSWTPQHLIVPHALTLLKPGQHLVSLLKPHYEAPKSWLKKGVVPAELLPQVIDLVKDRLAHLHIFPQSIIESPIRGEKGGNIEYLVLY